MRGLILLVLALAVVGVASFWVLTAPQTLAAADLPAHEPRLDNGERLFYAGGCASCHAAPGAKGADKLLLTGGLELETDFGTFVVPNISSDPNAGMGGWSDLEFVNAMKQGVAPDGSHYYPAFPYGSYQFMPIADLLDLKAFMDTLPASPAVHRDHNMVFPFNIRRLLGGWKFLYWTGETFQPDQNASEQVNLGAYLVIGPTHCGECHTPRDLFGGMKRGEWLAGAPEAEGRGFVPNITPHETGIADWTESDIVFALETGFDPDYDTFGGSMVSVQENMAQLPATDREAIAAYLTSIPGLLETPRPEPANNE